MTLFEHLHMLVRCWRYRLRSEAADIAQLSRLDLRNRTAIDIGANRGIYSYWMSKFVGPQGNVIAFELQPELHEALHEFKRRSSLDNVEIVMKGLSNQNGTVRISRDHAGSTGARVDEHSVDTSGGQEIPPGFGQLTRLDDYCREHRIRDIGVIKCDVEGHERQVFEGAEETLRTQRPILLFEAFQPEIKERGLFDYLDGLGYTGFFWSQGKRYDADQYAVAPYRRPTCIHRNYFFIPKANASSEPSSAERRSQAA